jgi:drug/metabolite transporter (DMT)-like permease
VRESAIVLVTGWGVWRLRERTGAWLRMAGAVAILAGVALIAFK